VLYTRAQYLLSCAELDDGCLANITWTQQERESDITHSLKYSDDQMQMVWIWRTVRGYGLNWLVYNRLDETDEYNRTETHEICSVSWRLFHILVAQQWESSPIQHFAQRHIQLKLPNSPPSSWSSWKPFVVSVYLKIESYVISHVITPYITLMFYIQCSWRSRVDSQR